MKIGAGASLAIGAVVMLAGAVRPGLGHDAPRTGLSSQTDATVLRLAQAASLDGAEFEVLRDTDLPGNDIVGPRQDPRLSGLSFETCRSFCGAVPACQAFTYNVKAQACFLKGAAGAPGPFRGAISGRRIAGAAAPAPAAEADGFDIDSDTDLPGNDYRSGFSEPALKGIALGQCRAACAADGRCQAFTYNAKAQVCFLKSATGRPTRFAGAMSGRRVGAEAGAGGGTAKGGVAGIREAAASFGGDCEAERAALSRLQAGTRVEAASRSLHAGTELALHWARGNIAGGATPKQRLPAYLVIATDRPVRLPGDPFFAQPPSEREWKRTPETASDRDHFYALLPGGGAPFGMETFQDRTRAVVPLFEDGAPASGTVAMRPLLSGPMKVEWAVVVYLRGCREEVAGPVQSIEIDVDTRSDPTIMLEEEADLSRPSQRIGLPEGAAIGDRVIEVYDGRYRLVNEEGAEIAERAGAAPRFSPTGRFVAATAEDGYEIVDAMDGALVYKDNQPGALAWAYADSFVVAGRYGWGNVQIVSPLQEGRVILWESGGCHACSGTETAVGIDLENDVAVISGDQDAAATRLSDPAAAAATDGEAAATRQEVAAFATRVAPFRMPRGWDLGSGFRVTHPADSGDPRLAGLLLRPVRLRDRAGPGKPAPAAARAADTGGVAIWRVDASIRFR